MNQGLVLAAAWLQYLVLLGTLLWLTLRH